MGDLNTLCGHNFARLVSSWGNETIRGLVATEKVIHALYFYASPVLCCLGVTANLAFMRVLASRKMRTAVNVLLIAIALSDAALMGASFVYHFSPPCATLPWAVTNLVYANLSVVAHSTSLWLTVAMAILRYAIVVRQVGKASASSVHTNACAQGGAGEWASVTRAALIAAATTAAVALFALPNLIRNHIAEDGSGRCGDGAFYTIASISWWTCGLEKSNFWLAGIVFKLVPCVLLTVFMSLLIWTLVEAKQRARRLGRDNAHHDRTTALLILIVLIFLVTEMPQGLLVLGMGVQPSFSVLYFYLGDFLDLLSLLNSSANFILYCAISQQFRDEAALVFCPARFRRLLGVKASFRGGSRRLQTTAATMAATTELQLPESPLLTTAA